MYLTLRSTPYSTCSGFSFVMEICCTGLLMVNKDSGAPGAGCAQVFVDGEEVLFAVQPDLLKGIADHSRDCRQIERVLVHRTAVHLLHQIDQPVLLRIAGQEDPRGKE